ncbi:hypothetical protein GPECTOR_50g598 [Gonium pectorale]|uniref:Leucine-rich repeat-containing N-terminal plant-type domain-containing protein n=1 Tax=Gonium pectorale TaxID=33097 RepID=A0A150G7I8_GONPE|nr:hypothetical protein GPECTOR_50g598 [Gonium pectorale]|eukprot:KXZ45804.1 hypothetical protein GPECTOR_50g598 [Gonium pectorale]
MLYKAWSGPSWTEQHGWAYPALPVCERAGVLCCLIDSLGAGGVEDVLQPGDPPCPANATGVVGLKLDNNNMTGDVADVPWAALGPTLLLLDLDGNSLGGSTEAWAARGGLASLARLQFLSMGENRLTGPLAPLTALPNLMALLLDHNSISGPLPPELFSHGVLQYLILDGNPLGGSLPAEVFLNSSVLRDVHLAETGLTGGFPDLPPGAVLAGFLAYLDVSRNALSGGLPRYLARALLGSLDASHNTLSGPVAPLLASSWSLIELKLRNNSLNGSIPADLSCKRLQKLDLSMNALSGTLPAVLGSLRSLVDLLLQDNPRLAGPLPAALGSNNALQFFDVRGTGMRAPVAGDAGLPPALRLSVSTSASSGGSLGPHCPSAVLRSGGYVGMSPYYWHYANCTCSPGATPVFNASTSNATTASAPAGTSSGATGGEGETMFCVPDGGPGSGERPGLSWWVVVIIVAGGLVLLGAGLLLVYRLLPSVVRYRAALAKRMPPGFSRRARGCVVTLVLTDGAAGAEGWSKRVD